MQNRELTSEETWREEISLLKKETNRLSQELVRAHAANARLEQQNGLQARQIEKLLGGGQTSGIRRQHERSLIAKRLREQLDGLRASLRERENTIAQLRRSHQHTLILELEAAKEEYFNECARLRRALSAKRDAFGGSPVVVGQREEESPRRPQSAQLCRRGRTQPMKKKRIPPKKKAPKKREDVVVVFDDAGSEDSGTGVAAGHDALQLLYREARETAIDAIPVDSTSTNAQTEEEERKVYYSRRTEYAPREQPHHGEDDAGRPKNAAFGEKDPATKLLAEEADEHSQASKVVHNSSSERELSAEANPDVTDCIEGILCLGHDEGHGENSGGERDGIRSPSQHDAFEMSEREALKMDEEGRQYTRCSVDDDDAIDKLKAEYCGSSGSQVDEYSSDAEYNDSSFTGSEEEKGELVK